MRHKLSACAWSMITNQQIDDNKFPEKPFFTHLFSSQSLNNVTFCCFHYSSKHKRSRIKSVLNILHSFVFSVQCLSALCYICNRFKQVGFLSAVCHCYSHAAWFVVVMKNLETHGISLNFLKSLICHGFSKAASIFLTIDHFPLWVISDNLWKLNWATVS